ncbi:MAG: hypothetical protein FJ026_03970 [Chloroflexi bacterium]|nr:hypothetical protein [Chloroflexota bacterium]
MNNRKKPTSEVETQVLIKSRRRCCLCWALEGNQNERLGQIAHVDRNPSNSDFENLAYLCLEHHARYDSRASQSKGFTETEVKTYRDELYRLIAQKYDSRPFYSLDGWCRSGTRTVTFTVAFPATPHVLVSPISKKPCTYALSEISTTGFTVNFRTEQHEEVAFNWLAFLDG